MKQHITFSQFNELSYTNQKKLKDWVYSKMQKEAEENNPGSFVSIMPPRVEDYCLSIGQMIEFLDEHTDLVNHEEYGPFKEITWFLDEELCDDLWEACKEVLK